MQRVWRDPAITPSPAVSYGGVLIVFGMSGRPRLAVSLRVAAVGAVAVLLVQGALAASADQLSADPASAPSLRVTPAMRAQLAAIQAEKRGRTPAQRKLDSQLLYAEKKARKAPVPAGFPDLATSGVKVDAQGHVLVDVDGRMNTGLLRSIQAAGGQVIGVPQTGSLRVRLPLTRLESLAAAADVTFVSPAIEPILHTGSVNSEGDTTHRAIPARTNFAVNGAGVKIGVLSDGVASLAASQASGNLGPVSVLPGQAGPAGANEGTAMLEIVHDLAPGAQLYFASAVNGEASFAQNIRDLRAAGCDIIVDDVLYLTEPVFQDGQVAQAVNDVTASGALYFSSSGNFGNLNDGQSGTWEGDFVPYTDPSGFTWADFDPTAAVQNVNPIALIPSTQPATLQWADPWDQSANDYDLFLLDSGGNVLASSTNEQSGVAGQDPWEGLNIAGSGQGGTSGRVLAVMQYSGAPRFMHLDLHGGRFAASSGFTAYRTAGQTYGHSAAADAFSVAATPARNPVGPGQPAGPYPGAFDSANVSERFTSDGPRRLFFTADGTPYTPGNFSSTGGIVRQKPDIAAADGVQTSVPGFRPFFGTSAAAPHAAAIAGLVRQANPSLTPAQVRTTLTTTAYDIEASGWDRDTGAGIVDAFAAVQRAEGVAVQPTYRPLRPARILDTRSGIGAPAATVPAGGSVTLQVTGRGGVPANGVGAAVLNVTVTQSTGSGFVTGYPTGTSRPTVSNLNFAAGQTIANLTAVKTGTGGAVTLYNGSSGTVHLIADVAGYHLSGAPTVPGAYGPLTPARILDTRTGNGAPAATVPAGGSVTLQVAGRGGVPGSGVGAAVLNVTVTQPTRAGFITVHPAGSSRPTASNLNFVAGQTVPNLVTVGTSAGGAVTFYNGSSGTVHLLADVAGYYVSGTPTVPGAYGPRAPARLLDTRSGIGAPAKTVPAGGSVTLQVTGRGGIPASGVGAAVLNVTVTQPTRAGFITVYPAGSSRPTVSNLNFGTGQTIPNLTTVKTGTGGAVTLYNGSSGTIHLVADIAGYFIA